MKKAVSILAAAALALALAACGGGAGSPSEAAVSAPPVQAAQPGSEASQPGRTGSRPESQAPAGAGASGEAAPAEEGPRALVVYFSATGNTRAVAQTIAALQGADLYEILPEEPYTQADLNYNDKTTRATAEQNDPDARPAISGRPEGLDGYDLIYLGYPIWWGDMPKILYTFLDTYDLSGKTIAPFCTSGGSGLSGTPGTIAELEPGAQLLEGLQVSDSAAGSAEDAVKEWLAVIGQAE